MTRKDVTNLFKRFLITFACTLPLLIALGFLLTNKVSDFVMIVIFVVIAGAVLAIEEYIHYKLYKKRERLKEEQIQKK
jgi:preprotein translocase subunit SecF